MSKKKLPVKIEDIAEYKTPCNLMYSPSGKRLAFDVKTPDLKKNDYRNDVWIAADGVSRRATYSADSSCVMWLDDGRLIIKRKKEGDSPLVTSLWVLSMDGGEAAPFMTLPFPLIRLGKATDDVLYAVGIIDSRNPDAYKMTPEEAEAYSKELKKEEDYRVVDETPFWFNGMGYINGKRMALFTVDLKKKAVKRITAPKFYVESVCADSGVIYYTGAVQGKVHSLYTGIYSYDAKSGKRDTIYSRNDMSCGRLFVLGGKLYVMATDMKDYGVNQTPDICLVDGRKLEKVYVPSYSLGNTVLSDTICEGGKQGDTAGDAFVTLETIEDHDAIIELDSKFREKKIWEKPGLVDCIAVSEGSIAVVYQDSQHLEEVFEMGRDGSGMKQVSDLNSEALKGRYVAEPKPLEYSSEGGSYRGWVLLPENFDASKKYPAVLDVHGGPRCAYGETFFHEMQVWVSMGYVVFFTNIWGSDGRGDRFADIRGLYGVTDYRNLMDFTDAVLKEYPNIDKKKLCETGGSYGGFMTNWIVGHTNRFCCAASQRSIANFISFSYLSDIGPWFGVDQAGAKDPLTDYKTLWEHSPLKYAKNAKTPTLFIHSEEDYRCPLPEGMQMMQAMSLNGAETRMVIFKGENHELSRSGKPQHRIRRLREISDWFEKHAK
ncbi:MAG: alpha/beta hydrolase family protein [Oscillospiraceae bacterium]|jgi:dipeptidyl aminopeptidase/acylaminoacyl peptidase